MLVLNALFQLVHCRHLSVVLHTPKIHILMDNPTNVYANEWHYLRGFDRHWHRMMLMMMLSVDKENVVIDTFHIFLFLFDLQVCAANTNDLLVAIIRMTWSSVFFVCVCPLSSFQSLVFTRFSYRWLVVQHTFIWTLRLHHHRCNSSSSYTHKHPYNRDCCMHACMHMMIRHVLR